MDFPFFFPFFFSGGVGGGIKLFQIPAVTEWHLIKEKSLFLLLHFLLFLPFHKISVQVD